MLITKPLADSEIAARQLVDEAKDSSVVNIMSLGIGLEKPTSIWANWLNKDISEKLYKVSCEPPVAILGLFSLMIKR